MHSVHVQLMLDDENLNRTRLKDVYTGAELPASVVFMQSNNYRCPHTKQLFPASNIDDAMLIAI